MYFALPTRTAATQMHQRVYEAITRAFPSESTRPPVVLAVPGYIAVDDGVAHRLPGFEVLWNDNEAERFRFRGWAAENPKRYLAGPIVVGTIDQVLLSTLMVSHAHMRATALLRQFLVVDEVHASDSYMIALLRSVW
jgi:CRISPR-associated endonuclease/helicase Cas3